MRFSLKASNLRGKALADMSPHWLAPPVPAHEVLSGHWSRLEPLDPAGHGSDLAAAFAGADRVWSYLPPTPPVDAQALREVLEEVAAREGMLAYGLIDLASGCAAGFLTIMEIRPADGVAEIGYVAFSPAMQRTRVATEAIFLLLRHLFKTGYRRVEWKCDNENAPSRHAAMRFGFHYEGLFRQHMVRKGRNRDTAWFAMLDGEWPAREAAFTAWLAPGNFDASGMQRTRLAPVNSSVSSEVRA